MFLDNLVGQKRWAVLMRPFYALGNAWKLSSMSILSPSKPAMVGDMPGWNVSHMSFSSCAAAFSPHRLCSVAKLLTAPCSGRGPNIREASWKYQWKYFSVRFWGNLSFFILDFFHWIFWLIAEAVMVSHAWDDTFVDLLLALFGDPKPCGDMLRDAPVFRTCQKLFWEVNNFDFGDQLINPYV